MEIDIEHLAEFSRRAPRRNLGGGWTMPPNIERITAAREKKDPAPKPKPVSQSQPSQASPGFFLRVAGDYTGLVDILRERADEMSMSREELDFQAGLQNGYTGKVLSRRHTRHLGIVSLGATLGALGLKMLLIEDTEQAAKILARRKPRERPVRSQTG